MWEKLKAIPHLSDQTFMAIVVVLVALSSFALGRHAGLAEGGRGVAIQPTVTMSYTETAAPLISTPPPLPTVAAATTSTEATFIASRSGTKYHHVSCAGAKQIKAENRITFTTETAAQAAGYSRAANCKYFTTP